MPGQTELGKAFEYACLIELNNRLSQSQIVEITQNESFRIAKQYFENCAQTKKSKMTSAAVAASRVIIRYEPQLEHPNGNLPLVLSIQEDAQGIRGDVRDVLCIRRQNEWEIGISCKHNHNAVKHSRLSKELDFGDKWFESPCSPEYFREIAPLFDELTEMKNAGELWRSIVNKDDRFYVPLLNAFMRELRRIYSQNPQEISSRLISYLLGRNDFYKVIANDINRSTTIQAFNLYGTLNRPSGVNRTLTTIPQVQLPTRIFNLDFKPESSNTIEIVLNHGWSISLRIHSASSRVEPSLKFDVHIVGMPPTILSSTEPWD